MLHPFSFIGASKFPRALALHNFFLVIIVLTACAFVSAAPVGFVRSLEREPIGLLQNLHQRYHRVWAAQRPFHAHTNHEGGGAMHDLAAQNSQRHRKHEGATGANGLPASVALIMDRDTFDIHKAKSGAETVNEELLRDILWSE